MFWYDWKCKSNVCLFLLFGSIEEKSPFYSERHFAARGRDSWAAEAEVILRCGTCRLQNIVEKKKSRRIKRATAAERRGWLVSIAWWRSRKAWKWNRNNKIVKCIHVKRLKIYTDINTWKIVLDILLIQNDDTFAIKSRRRFSSIFVSRQERTENVRKRSQAPFLRNLDNVLVRLFRRSSLVIWLSNKTDITTLS